MPKMASGHAARRSSHRGQREPTRLKLLPFLMSYHQPPPPAEISRCPMSSMWCCVLVLTLSPQEAREVFDEALSGADVERNAEGQIKVDGATIIAWTSKIPE